jgi:hypothetical protein
MRGRSWLRKCIFMQIPDEIRNMAPPVSPAAMPPPPPRPREVAAADIVPHERNPARDVREFPMFVPHKGMGAAAGQAHALHMQNAQKAAVNLAADKAPAMWWEDPVALGTLLILVPPIGLAAVWASKRYSSDARWALTIMTALMMCLMSAVVIAVLAMH